MPRTNTTAGFSPQTLNVSELNEFHRNPRQGNIPAIIDSLRRLGQYRPIVVNKGTKTGRPMEVLAGNHTLAAARQLGWETIAAVVVDVDEDTAIRIVLADNRTSDLATNDDEILASLLSELPDLDATGYTSEDLARLLDDGGELPAEFASFDESIAATGDKTIGKAVTCPACGHEFTTS